MNLVKGSVVLSNSNYLDLEYVTISNLQGTCRFCKNYLFANSYSFGQCSMSRNPSQRFHIVRGSTCNSYSIMSADTTNNKLLSYQNSIDFEIISVNTNGGVAIKVFNQNKCITNNLQDNLIPPFDLTEIQQFTDCLPYNSDESQVFYFYQYVYETNNSYNCKSETSALTKFTFFEITKSAIATSILIQDTSNITISDGIATYSKQVLASNVLSNFEFWIEINNGYAVTYTVQDAGKYEYVSTNFNVVGNAQHNIAINIKEKVRQANVTFPNFSSIQLADNSDIKFTNNYLGEDVLENVGSTGFSSFSKWLYYGSHDLFLTMKTPNHFEFDSATSTTLPLIIDDSTTNPFTFAISILEKVSKVTVTIISGTSSLLADNSDIKFTNTTIGGDYTKNVGISAGITTFDLNLHYGSYNLFMTMNTPNHFEFDSATSTALPFAISDRNPTSFSISILEKVSKVTVTIVGGTSSLLIDNSDIKFTNTTIGGDYTKNVGISTGITTFDINLHYGDYTLTIQFKSPLYYRLDPTFSIPTINSRVDRTLNITILPITPLMWYKFNGNFYNEITNSNDITSLIPNRFAWSGDYPKSGVGWTNNSLHLYEKATYGINWVRYIGQEVYSGTVDASGTLYNTANIFTCNPCIGIYSYVLTTNFYAKDFGGIYTFYTHSDNESYVYLDGNFIVQDLDIVEDNNSVALNINQTYQLVVKYTEYGGLGNLIFQFSHAGGLAKGGDGRNFYRLTLNADIRLPNIFLNNSYSFSFWIKILSGNTLNERIFEFKNTGTGKNIGLILVSGNVAIRRDSVNENSGVTASVNSWSHFVLVLEVGLSIKLYKNKILSFTSSSFTHNSSHFYNAIGNLGLDVDRNSESLLSLFKDFRVYGEALSQSLVDLLHDE